MRYEGKKSKVSYLCPIYARPSPVVKKSKKLHFCDMKRILYYLAIAGTVITFLSKSAVGQEDAWIKLTLPNNLFDAVETTPYGIFAGEHDSRTSTPRYNGVYKSTDLGETWEQAGLADRRISDIAYNNGKIYVATRMVVGGTVGLFMSEDGGTTWTHNHPPGIQFSTWSVASLDTTIVLGTASYGLWVSFDEGQTWEQKIGSGVGPDVYKVAVSPEVFVATTNDKVYKSTDGGNTWEEIPALAGKIIRNLEIHENVILAGAPNFRGLFRSADHGETWTAAPYWGSFRADGILFFDGIFYVGKQTGSSTYSVVKSTDSGVTWQDTNLNTNGPVLDLTALASEPDYIYAVTTYNGVHRLAVHPEQPTQNAFLEIPWETSDSSELVDKITSVFDHRYPLIGYGYHSEPMANSSTTMDYLGNEKEIPDLYYSGHDAIDFGLVDGTEIKAPAAGYATYYYCNACGHTIKVNHQNGYETTYYHLRGDGLITTEQIPVWVNAGDVLGKVGLTGNTSGYHLHFSVLKDKNGDGAFVGDSPYGKVDPFGWFGGSLSDPWEVYNWTDTLGTHTGSKSDYLWRHFIDHAVKYFGQAGGEVTLDNKTVTLDENSYPYSFSLLAHNYVQPVLSIVQQHLQYIPHTSVLIDAYDNLGTVVDILTRPAKLQFNFSAEDLQNIAAETLKVYSYNEILGSWEPLNTLLLDLVENKISAETAHFSKFAVFGEKVDATPPVTEVTVEGERSTNGWYITHPTVSLSADDGTGSGVAKILYRIAVEIDWTDYTQPFVVDREGVFGIEYRAVDSADNLEGAKNFLVRVNTLGNRVWTNTVVDASFEIGSF